VTPEAITLNSTAVGFDPADTGVQLRLANGSAVSGDLLVGADGFNSVIRRALHPHEPPPRSAGLVAVRGVTHGAIEQLRGLDAVYYIGPGIESMLVRASDTGIYWFLSLASELLPAGMTDPREIMQLKAPLFDQTFRAITTAADDLRYDALFDRDVLPSWGTGAVTLLGDAAHPMLPQTGQGAAQAIVDAVALANAVSGSDRIEDALRSYENERRTKTAVLVSQGRRTARVMGLMNPIACWAREMALRLIPVKPLARYYGRVNRRAGTATD
jgi:2-polyprenyl-6-methoxyphenol hydroxylase-like FAD-dependent oxidoreductase